VKLGKPKIILCGETITLDEALVQRLKEFSDLEVFINCLDLLTLSHRAGQELILWEVSESNIKHLKELSLIKDKYPGIKIIVIIEGVSTKGAAEILKAGASDIFPKPVDHDLLIDRVVALLSLKN
jgi:DNA-binding NtrC family response regulator